MNKYKILIITFIFYIFHNLSYWYFWFERVKDDIIWETNWDISFWIQNVLTYFLGFLALISVIFVIKWWFQILTAGWDDEWVKNWKKTLLYALLWLFVIWISYAIVWQFTLWLNNELSN